MGEEEGTAIVSSGKGLASRLRSRLEQQEIAEKNKVKRRLTALYTEEQMKAGVKKPTGPDEAAVAATAAATVAAQLLVLEEKLLEEGKRENYPVFFHMLMLVRSHALHHAALRLGHLVVCAFSVCWSVLTPSLLVRLLVHVFVFFGR